MENILEYAITLAAIASSSIGAISIMRKDWKRYGLLFLISGLLGNLICILFISLNFYEFPITPFSFGLPFPLTAVLTAFPFYVLLGVNFSPRRWVWKFPFYWALVNLGVFIEALIVENTKILKYNPPWDLWDSYSTWWLFFLGMEYIGGMIIPQEKRRPISIKSLRYGRWAWIVTHIIFTLTVFLAGVYLGRKF